MSHKKIYLLLSLFIILSLACSFSGSAGNTGEGDPGLAPDGGGDTAPTAEPADLGYDACLVGTWQQGTDEISSNIAEIFAESGMEVVSVEGVFHLVIVGNQMTLTPEGYTIQIRNQLGDLIGASMTGTNVVEYEIVSEGMMLATDVEDNLVLTMDVAGTSMSFPLEGSFFMGVDPSVSFPYTCDATTFTAQTPPDIPFESSTYTRVSAP